MTIARGKHRGRSIRQMKQQKEDDDAQAGGEGCTVGNWTLFPYQRVFEKLERVKKRGVFTRIYIVLYAFHVTITRSFYGNSTDQKYWNQSGSAFYNLFYSPT